MCFRKGKKSSQLGHKGPSMNTLENILCLNQYLIQKLNVSCSLPLLQLPHISEEDLKHFVTKKRKIRTLQELGSLGEDERRLLLRRLTDEQYDDVINVLSGLPRIEMTIELEVIDIHDQFRVTAGALVTVNVYLLRTNVLQQSCEYEPSDVTLQLQENETDMNQASSVNYNQPSVDMSIVLESKSTLVSNCNDKQYYNHSSKGNKKNKQGKNNKSNKNVDNKVRNRKLKSVNNTPTDLSASQTAKVSKKNTEIEILEEPINGDDMDEDKEFEMLQKTILKKTKNQKKDQNKISHVVHCPHFKEDRYEGWWSYMTDPKKDVLTAAPKYIPDLIHSYETDLKFQAPTCTGKYQYKIHLVSDSYIGLDVSTICQFTVYAADTTDLNEYDYGLDDTDNEADNDLIEQVETTSDEASDGDHIIESDDESN